MVQGACFARSSVYSPIESRGLTSRRFPLRTSQEIESHPLESLTFHGFNPVTSHKKEWTGTLPQFLSALQSRNLHTVTFVDVPSLRNKRRHLLTWDNVDHLESVTTLQISLATTVDEGEAAAEAEDHDDDFDPDEVDEKGEMTLRVSRWMLVSSDCNSSPQPCISRAAARCPLFSGANLFIHRLQITPNEIKYLLTVFPNLNNLLLANFHRCKRPTKHDEESGESADSDDPGTDSRFAEETFQPAARDFIHSLALYDSFKGLEQVVFRSAEAELGVRFRRERGPGTRKNIEGWHEELRRLY